MEFAQLRLADLGRGIGERAGSRLGFWKRNDVADALGAGHQHGDPVQSERNAAVWWRAKAQRIEQKAELGAGFIGADAQKLKDHRLQLMLVDADRATAKLRAVEHQIVS